MALDDYLASEIVLDCADGIFSRREALRRLMLLGVTAPAAAALLAACGDDDDSAAPETTGSTIAVTGTSAPNTTSPGTTAATSVSTPATSADTAPAGSTDASGSSNAALAEEIRFAGPQGELIGVFAEADDPSGSVLVIHENRGLTDHIRSIPPRLAADGYNALAIDLLSEEGGTASMASEGDATAALGNAPAERMIADLRAGLDELQRRAPDAKLATIGFCFGGGMTWQLLAAGEPRLSAAVPFYGPAPAEPDFTGSPNAAVLGIYAELDSRVNASQDTARRRPRSCGSGARDPRVSRRRPRLLQRHRPRYDAEQAAQAYQAMITWFGDHLSG